jgi:Extensin-like protein C-terminus
MVSGARCYFVGSAVLGAVATLSGCSGGFFFAEREPWRHEAEMQCLNAGLVPEGSGIVRLDAIRGPGICGADFPLKVSILGEGTPTAFADDPRPPAAIPSGLPSWPIAKPRAREGPALQDAPAPYPGRPRPRYESAAAEQPISLNPPGIGQSPAAMPENYDFRRPYGAAAPKHGTARPASSPGDDLSPVPYERRRLVEGDRRPHETSSAVVRAPLRDLVAADAPRASAREDLADELLRRPHVPPLLSPGTSRGEQAAGVLTPVSVSPPATLACPMVSELDRWITSAVQPAALRWFGSPVAEIKQISAYSCRGMNGNSRARISEHAFGNALDIAAFTLADGRTVTVKKGWHGLPEEQGFLRDVQGAACDQFSTVLAPGSNVYHYDHIHVDLMRRGSGYRTCNPHAVSGDEVAARAGGKWASRTRPAHGTAGRRRRRLRQ